MLSTPATKTEQLDHFIRLARRGAGPGASGGERRANQLAVAMVEALPGLDAEAVTGMLQFAQLNYENSTLARELLEL